VSKRNVNNIIDTLGCSAMRVPLVPCSLNVKNSENSENSASSDREKSVNCCKERTATILKVKLKKRLKKFVQAKERSYEPKCISTNIKFDAYCKEYQKYLKIVKCTQESVRFHRI